jgi:hypothetical protein
MNWYINIFLKKNPHQKTYFRRQGLFVLGITKIENKLMGH